MLICDQCEREFHIGCLAKHMHEVVPAIPQGSWFCSADCKHVSHALQVRLCRDRFRPTGD